MRQFRSALMVLSFMLPAAGTALAWGDAPTHASICEDLVIGGNFPQGIDPEFFVRACSCPDVAYTETFKAGGFGYVHTREFADVLLDVARESGRKDLLATAYAFGAHIAADEVGHAGYFLAEEPVHSLAEVSVDTVVYYNRAPWTGGWDQYYVDWNTCNPLLIYYAADRYAAARPGTIRAGFWESLLAVAGLSVSIRLEYDYIKAKGNDDLSVLYLKGLEDQGILPKGMLGPTYVKSVESAMEWIASHP